MIWPLWRYELRRLGRSALLGPLLALAALSLFAALAARAGIGPQTDRILSELLDVLPVIGGLGAASIVVSDPALELQLSLPTPFRQTVLRRLALALGWMGLLGLGCTLALAASGRLVWPVPPLANQLLWLAPLLWLAGLGAALSLAMGTAAAGTSLVGLVWVLELALGNSLAQVAVLRPVLLFLRFDPARGADWMVNRLTLLALAVIWLGWVVWLLGRPEQLLRGES